MMALDYQPKAGDTLTVLTSAGPRLTKVWDSAVGKPLGYEKAQQVSVSERFVQGIYELSALLVELEGQRNSCIIRGKFIGHAAAADLYPAEIERDRKRGKALAMPKEGFTLRRLTFFKEQPLHFFYADVDGFRPVGIDPVLEPEAAIQQYIAQALPACFQGVTFHWQLSSGAGHPDNKGVLKAHIAFWLTTAVTGEALEAWAKSLALNIDVTVFRTVQPNYTAAPMFINGVVDPVPVRSGLCEGFLGDEVDLVIDSTVVAKARSERKRREDMVDPREKDNLIGMFCRTFEIEDVVANWLSDVFEFVTDTRLTWLLSSSGAAEGAGVTDNRQGIFNTHSTDPLGGRAANKWDLVRHYKFGYLDAELDETERVLLGIGNLPSQEAMTAWVKDLPEIKAATAAESVKSSESHLEAINAAQDEVTLREIAQRIAQDGSIDRVAKDILAGTLQAKFGVVGNGVKPSIAAVRDLVGMGKRRKSKTSGSGPDWVQGWCYVTSQSKFFNVNTKELIGREAFDAAHCRLMPVEADGSVPSAAKVACDLWQIPAVYNLMYLPSMGDFFAVDGQEYANLYRPESVPARAEGLPEDDASLAVLHRHVELIIPDAKYRELFLQWAAWVVRNPGQKVLWAVFIKGVEGDGKSILGSMMAAAMGHANVGVISPETLSGSNFNDWAVGRCLNVIEEMKMQGHNRHDVYNKVKPLITNSRIEVHGKGKASTTAVNTVNYIGFSNHSDAIPLDDHDRRQFVLFTPWGNISVLHQRIVNMGLNPDTYWETLWDVVKNRPEVVREFFERINLGGFNPHGRAPHSHFKDIVVSLGVSDEESVVRDLIASGVRGVGAEVISSACLTTALELSSPPVVIQTSAVRRLLLKMGYLPYDKLVKWEGSPHRVWVTSQVTSQVTSLQPAQIREMLDATNIEEFLK